MKFGKPWRLEKTAHPLPYRLDKILPASSIKSASRQRVLHYKQALGQTSVNADAAQLVFEAGCGPADTESELAPSMQPNRSLLGSRRSACTRVQHAGSKQGTKVRHPTALRLKPSGFACLRCTRNRWTPRPQPPQSEHPSAMELSKLMESILTMIYVKALTLIHIKAYPSGAAVGISTGR